jgi:uncharacterized membrane protein YadS
LKEKKLGLYLTFILLIISIIISKKFNFNDINTALTLGIIVGNLCLGKYAYKFYPGFEFANKKILPIAITVLGVKLNYIVLMELGVKIIFFVFIMVILLLLSGKYIARFMGPKEEFGMILSSGGVASIVASNEVLGESEENFALAIISMNILGLTAMTIMPFISQFIGFTPTESALYIGGTLNSFIHIIPAGYAIGSEALGLALLIKTGKLMFFPLVLIYMAKMKNKPKDENIKQKKVELPHFIKGFMVVGLIFTLLEFSITKVQVEEYTKIIKDIEMLFNQTFKYLMMFALIGIGGKINIKGILIKGKSLISYSLVLMAVQLILGAITVKVFY